MGSNEPAASGTLKSPSFGRRLAAVGDAVMIRHTLFSLPFALAAVLLETGGRPPRLEASVDRHSGRRREKRRERPE